MGVPDLLQHRATVFYLHAFVAVLQQPPSPGMLTGLHSECWLPFGRGWPLFHGESVCRGLYKSVGGYRSLRRTLAGGPHGLEFTASHGPPPLLHALVASHKHLPPSLVEVTWRQSEPVDSQ
jgi:hypothetical protein